MIFSLMYIIFAVLALSFLIFIHELGHYWMARRVGMRVEAFSIGFGRPIFSWMRDGVKWQIGWILCGGYVKIAGQDLDNEKDPYEIQDGFFGKSPFDRIKVAAMGPIVNLVFAFILFAFLWIDGGREKHFSDFTPKIGWVDPNSELYAKGIRPGDEVVAYNDKLFESSKDHISVPLTSSGEVNIRGYKYDYKTLEKIPFDYTVKTYPHPASVDKGIQTDGILESASYIIYDKMPGGTENPLPEGSPLDGSGIQYGDRIVWVDGEQIFGLIQLNHILNDGRALLTIERNGKILLKRIPRVPAEELKLDPSFKDELIDWQFEANLNGVKIQNLYVIPYNLSNEGVVENDLKFIDKDNQQEAFPKYSFSNLEEPLTVGDKIIAVDGKPVSKAYEILDLLQKRRVNVIVERNPELTKIVDWREADAAFNKEVDWKDLSKIALSIGTPHLIHHSGDFYLLKPVTPKMERDFANPEKKALITDAILARKKQIDSIEDPDKRARQLQLLETTVKQLKLGLPGSQDRKVNYNPTPDKLFYDVFSEIWRTLSAMVSGSLNPKWLSGPVGIVQVVQENWMVSTNEALYWIAAISLNLGFINLLPIPMLDGGTIVICFIEMVTGKRMSPKTLEKLIFPFAILLIAFFVYLTYNDLARTFGNFLPF